LAYYLSKLIRWWCCPPALPRPPGCLRCLPRYKKINFENLPIKIKITKRWKCNFNIYFKTFNHWSILGSIRLTSLKTKWSTDKKRFKWKWLSTEKNIYISLIKTQFLNHCNINRVWFLFLDQSDNNWCIFKYSRLLQNCNNIFFHKFQKDDFYWCFTHRFCRVRGSHGLGAFSSSLGEPSTKKHNFSSEINTSLF